METNLPRAWRAYVSDAKYESLRMLRAPAFAGPFLLLPAGLYMLFGVVLFGGDIAKDPKTALFLFMGFSIMGVMGPGMFGFGITISTEREHGLLRLRRALPGPPAAPGSGPDWRSAPGRGSPRPQPQAQAWPVRGPLVSPLRRAGRPEPRRRRR